MHMHMCTHTLTRSRGHMCAVAACPTPTRSPPSILTPACSKQTPPSWPPALPPGQRPSSKAAEPLGRPFLGHPPPWCLWGPLRPPLPRAPAKGPVSLSTPPTEAPLTCPRPRPAHGRHQVNPQQGDSLCLSPEPSMAPRCPQHGAHSPPPSQPLPSCRTALGSWSCLSSSLHL